MKAHKSLPRKREQRKPLPAPFNEQQWEKLLPYEKAAYFLAEARLKTAAIEATAHIDAINWLHHRVVSLCTVVGEAAYSASGSEMPPEALAVVMGIIEEDIQVAKRIAGEMFDLLRDRRRFPTGGAA
jgi:hypothetical protein